MKYVETVWEKRNLGVDSCKYIIEKDDNVEAVIPEISRCTKEYIEVFVEIGNIESIWKLEENGFRFFETIFDLYVNKNDMVIPPFYVRLLKNVIYEKALEFEVEIILQQIASGEMFLSDKIALNPKFGTQAAGKRYYFWMKEFFKQQGECYAVKYKNQLMGFEAVEMRPGNIVDLVLGGVLPRFTGAGVSPLLHGARVEYWKNKNFKKMYGHVSSNNFPVIKCHEIYGFKLDKAQYVLVKCGNTNV